MVFHGPGSEIQHRARKSAWVLCSKWVWFCAVFVCLFYFRLKWFLIVSLIKAHILLFKILFILSSRRLSDTIFFFVHFRGYVCAWVYLHMCACVCLGLRSGIITDYSLTLFSEAGPLNQFLWLFMWHITLASWLCRSLVSAFQGWKQRCTATITWHWLGCCAFEFCSSHIHSRCFTCWVIFPVEVIFIDLKKWDFQR